jgi:uncharacterized protein
MQINVAQQLKGPIGTVRHYPVDETMELDEGVDCPIKGEVSLTLIDRGILVTGYLGTEVPLDCSRCLTPFRCPLEISLKEIFYPTINITDGLPTPAPDEPSAFTIDEHHIIDLTEAVRQYCLMAIPMKPLCHEDCAGLCPVCGGNLNTEKCTCPIPAIDPRWSKLKELSLSTKVKPVPKKRKGAK